MDGTVNFYRPWDQYKMGFGDAAGEYWLGESFIYDLQLCTKQPCMFLTVCLCECRSRCDQHYDIQAKMGAAGGHGGL